MNPAAAPRAWEAERKGRGLNQAVWSRSMVLVLKPRGATVRGSSLEMLLLDGLVPDVHSDQQVKEAPKPRSHVSEDEEEERIPLLLHPADPRSRLTFRLKDGQTMPRLLMFNIDFFCVLLRQELCFL